MPSRQPQRRVDLDQQDIDSTVDIEAAQDALVQRGRRNESVARFGNALTAVFVKRD